MTEESEITEAKRLFDTGQREAAADRLRTFLSRDETCLEALKLLARASADPRKAAAAAELALALAPEDGTAKKVVADSRGLTGNTSTMPRQPDVVRTAGMTLSEARAVRWPFDSLSRPIGVLIDEGKITARDLGWAWQQAQDEIMRQAAKTVLLGLLMTPGTAESSGPLRVIEGSPHSAYRRHRSTAVAGLITWFSLGVGILGLVSLVVGLLFGFLPDNLPSFYFLLPGLFLLLFATIAIELASFYMRELDQMKLGRESVDRTIDAFRASLAAPWVLIRNIDWHDRKRGDIDLLLVGTGGIWAFEVEAYSGTIRNSGEKWEYKSKRGWKTLSTNPGKQASRNAAQVQRLVEKRGLPATSIHAAIVLASKDANLELWHPAVPVWKLDELPGRIQELRREQRLTADQIPLYVSILETTVRRS